MSRLLILLFCINLGLSSCKTNPASLDRSYTTHDKTRHKKEKRLRSHKHRKKMLKKKGYYSNPRATKR